MNGNRFPAVRHPLSHCIWWRLVMNQVHEAAAAEVLPRDQVQRESLLGSSSPFLMRHELLSRWTKNARACRQFSQTMLAAK